MSLPASVDDRDRFARRLAGDGPPLRLDGATGTELERRGLRTGLPLWSTHALLEAPEVVGEVHASHLRAGAEVVTANTFRTQRRTLERAGLGRDDDARLTALAIALARGAIRDVQDASSDEVAPRWVAGSLPPLEDCYAPERVPERRALDREHGRQATLLAEAGADLLLIETMNCRREAEAASRAAARTGRSFVVGFVAWAPDALLSGESLGDAARAVIDLGASAVGVNCVPPSTLEAHRSVLGTLGAGLFVAPNLGEPDDRTGFARREDLGAEDFAAALAGWLAEPSLALVGGCCGTTPDHVEALSRALGGLPKAGDGRRATGDSERHDDR